MNDKTITVNTPPPSDFHGLPYEPESESELLSATNVFVVEVISLDTAPWTVGNNNLEQRELAMQFRLLKNYKGKLDLQPDYTFRLSVYQQRESEFFVTDYHGLWSHLEPKIGIRYLVISTGDSTDPSKVMQENNLNALLGSEYEPDIQLSLEAQELYEEYLRKEVGDNALVAIRALIKFTLEKRRTAKDLFGRFLWARVGPIFLYASEELLPKVLEIIQSKDSTIDLRRTMIEKLYESVLLCEQNTEMFRSTIKAFAMLLQDESASPLHSTLIEVQLYNLIFQDEQARFPEKNIFIEQSERAMFKAALEKFDLDRAHILLSWLKDNI